MTGIAALATLLLGLSAPTDVEASGHVSSPIATGKPHICGEILPAKDASETQLDFTVTAAGTVASIRVSKSSGSDSQDNAAIRCVRSWTYEPGRQNGHEVETTWQALVSSQVVERAPDWSGGQVGIPHNCDRYYPRDAEAFGLEGDIVLQFTVTDEGKVTNPWIEHSSGSDLLDQAALICVPHWRYKPAKEDGKPVAVQWRASVSFRFNNAPFAETPRNCAQYYKAPESTEIRFTAVRYEVRNGAIVNAIVVASSGDADLDAKALVCVRSWRFVTTMADGSSPSASGAKIINWSNATTPFLRMEPPQRLSETLETDSACEAAQTREGGRREPVSVAFAIDVDGLVSEPRIATSSGDPDLDRMLLRCIATWRLKPATIDGKPVALHWEVDIAN